MLSRIFVAFIIVVDCIANAKAATFEVRYTGST